MSTEFTISDAPVTLLYRGPFQMRRLQFLAESVARAYGPPRLVWLAPPQVDSRQAREMAEARFAQWPFLTSHRVLDGSLRAFAGAVRWLRRATAGEGQPLVAAGFTALLYARALGPRPLVWCVNGIPEEALLHADTVRNRLQVRALWAAARRGRTPDLVVTVSEPMSRLVQRRCGAVAAFNAPTCVDTEVFEPAGRSERRYLTYLGTGAPWQDLGQLARVWGCMAQLNPTLRFRVISRDPRARVLGGHVDEQAVAFDAGRNPGEVAALLDEAAAGFIVRRPHIVNEVSFPTKFGEYVASGIPVITTDIGWEISDIVKETGCGVTFPWSDDPAHMGHAVDRFLREGAEPGTMHAGCAAAARRLDRSVWIERLADRLTSIGP